MRRIVADRAHPMSGEQVREDPRHRAPVLHHVRDARRRAEVVLEHAEVALGVADQIDAGDMDAHPVRRDDPNGLAVEVLARSDEAARDNPVTQDFLLAVDVVEVVLERLDPLGDATLEARPLRSGDHPRHEVQRERPLLAGKRERDALVDERSSERIGPGLQLGGIRRGKLVVDALVRPPDVARSVEHLVEGLRIAAQLVVAVEDAVVPFLCARVGARRTCGLCREGSKAHP